MLSHRVSGPTLSLEELQQYVEHGFVMLGPVLNQAELEALRSEERRFRSYPGVDLNGNLSPDGLTIFRSQLANYSEPLRDVYFRGAHLGAVKQLISPNLCAWFNQYVTKLPDDPAAELSEFPWHQDNGYVSLEPATNVTVWIALDDVNEQNGCVWVLPGSHKRGLLRHESSATSWHLEVKVEGDGTPAILKAGEAIAFSGLTLHRSLANKTDRIRRGFFMEYADAASAYGPEKIPVTLSPNATVITGSLPWPEPGKKRQ